MIILNVLRRLFVQLLSRNSKKIMSKNIANHNYGVDFVRFGLILWIVIHHYTCVYNVIENVHPINFQFQFTQGGHVGNACFFILSGYFMGKVLFNSSLYSIKEFCIYCIRRYIRFYPTYALAVILISVWMYFGPLPERGVGFIKFLVNFLFIIHPSGFVDGAHWFVAILLLCQCSTMLLKFTPPRSVFHSSISSLLSYALL